MKKTRLICIMLTAVLLAIGGVSCSRDDDNVPDTITSDSTNNNPGDQSDQNQGDDDNGHNNGDNSVDNSTGDWVDLGLPSGLLWASHNVGATTPEDYGDHFAWGETCAKSVYNWDTYAYCNGGYDKLTKYCNDSDYGYNGFTDNLTTLKAIDDAATANWGSGARTPTKTDWEELRSNCTGAWVTQNGVNGYRFIGRNGNTIFLPASGYRWGYGLDDIGSSSHYWSSSRYIVYPNQAWSFFFYSVVADMSNNDRNYGFPVRPVRSAH